MRPARWLAFQRFMWPKRRALLVAWLHRVLFASTLVACSSATTTGGPQYIGGCTWVDTDAGAKCETDAGHE